MTCNRWLVSGRVQGVFFRGSTRRVAESLGLGGIARNLPDGRVEVVACGKPEALERLGEWLREGPDLARVDALTREVVPHREFPGFTTA